MMNANGLIGWYSVHNLHSRLPRPSIRYTCTIRVPQLVWWEPRGVGWWQLEHNQMVFVVILLLILNGIAWASQYIHIRRKGSEMSTHVALLGILSCIVTINLHVLDTQSWQLPIVTFVSLACHLAMLELVTRVRREQRMLPVSLYHSFTFRLKHFRRYFWQWDDFPSYLYCSGLFFVGAFLVLYVCSYLPFFDFVRTGAELIAIFADACTLLPQFRRNLHDHSAEALTKLFIGALFAHDLIKLIVQWFSWKELQGSLALVLSAAVLKLLVDILLAVQSFAYRRSKSHEY